MKILAFSDWRVQSIETIGNIIDSHDPDAVLYAGDDLTRLVGIDGSVLLRTPRNLVFLNHPGLEPEFEQQKKLFTETYFKHIEHFTIKTSGFFRQITKPLHFVNGNDDPLLHEHETYFLGFGSTFCRDGKDYFIAETPTGKITVRRKNWKDSTTAGRIWVTINPSFGHFTISNRREKVTVFGVECEYGLDTEIRNVPKNHADIYLSHLPPLGTLDLAVRFGIKHIGSRKLLKAVKKNKPRMVICGHSHAWGGRSENIGDTVVINVSSEDNGPRNANFAIIDTKDWSFQIETVNEHKTASVRGVMSSIRKTIAMELDGDLTGPAITEVWKAWNKIVERGDWLKTGNIPEEDFKIIEKVRINAKTLKARLESITWDRPKILKRITFDPDKYAFVDVETGLARGADPGKLWLVGLWHNGELRQFIIPEQEHSLITFLKSRKITALVAWTKYDSKALSPLLNTHKIKMTFIDACQRTANCVVWHSYRLHELYHALFPEEPGDTPISGFEAGVYADHLLFSEKPCHSCKQREKSIVKLIKERNKIDLIQMVDICGFLWKNRKYDKIQ